MIQSTNTAYAKTCPDNERVLRVTTILARIFRYLLQKKESILISYPDTSL